MADSKDRSKEPVPAPPPNLFDWLSDHGDALFAYAVSRVQDRSLAEDFVQDTFLVALKRIGSFRAQSDVQTWLISILRHKILDHYRRQARQRRLADDEGDYARQYFSKRGKFQHVSAWDPTLTDNLEQREFQEMLDRCLRKLGAVLSQVFMLRIMDEISTDDICKILEITPSNLSIRLHRARLGLRECLQRNWFERE